ncbi:MAG: penicillin-insensitive murein endopeptidase [Deltaproteobacteria bacterium]|nr:penicillin-insensitive murein endopeptidase [Deltaproteobacteria bacterium]
MRRCRGVVPALAVLSLSGCMGVFADDRSSISLGSHVRGALLHPVALPFEGPGYEVHPDWRPRDCRYATEEVARWLADVFREVVDRFPDSIAFLGDISGRRGGDVAMHRSHASGRDVDVFYYACDDAGRPLRDLPAMLHFGRDGRAERWSLGRGGRGPKQPVPQARFDARRNWALVRAMLSTPGAEVQWIFVHHALAALMLAEAERQGTDPAIIGRARVLLHQPTNSQPHDDHMHVRLFCDPADRPLGCNDKGPVRWLKKHWKYMRVSQASALRL